MGKSAALELSPVELLVFQATPFCNIDCKYCYLPDRASKSRISLDTIRTTCRQLAADGLVSATLDVLWHAGEPLVLPTDFYEAAFEIIGRELAGVAIQHRFQTNATLLDASWADFLRRHRVAVGISSDGPPRLHDRYRTTRAGRSTSAQVVAGVEALKRAGFEPHVICVLTRESIGSAYELFEFFESIGVVSVGFNADQAGGPYAHSSHDGVDPLPRFRQFLRDYFRLVRESGSKQHVRELTDGLKAVFKPEIQTSIEAVPLKVLTVSHSGDFGTFSPDLLGLRHPEFGELTFGNVHEPEVFSRLREDARFARVYNSICLGIQACERECGYFEVCKGGVPAAKFGEHGTFEATETIACKFNRQAKTDAVVDLVLSGLLKAADAVPA
ncbi:MAG: cyclophane-forming radical SAM/SPASM peptide maturase GrrM/OscB [Thermomicrobiales bacterium]